MESLRAKSKNIAQHCEEASILAGNEVCQMLMRHASGIIHELLAELDTARAVPDDYRLVPDTATDPTAKKTEADAANQEAAVEERCPHCQSVRPYHELSCPVAVAALAQAEGKPLGEQTVASLARFDVSRDVGGGIVRADAGRWVAFADVVKFLEVWESQLAAKHKIEEQAIRHGKSLFEFARQVGWIGQQDEGAIEFVSRKSYEQGIEDAGAQKLQLISVGEAASMPGADAFTMACFQTDMVPRGTKLYITETDAGLKA